MHYVHAVVGGTAGWGSGISSISVCDSGLEEAVPGRVLLWSGQARQQQQQLASLVPPSPASLGLGWEHCQPATQSPAFVVPQMHNWRSGSLNYYLKCITAHARTHTGCNIMHKRSVHDVRVVLYWVILSFILNWDNKTKGDARLQLKSPYTGTNTVCDPCKLLPVCRFLQPQESILQMLFNGLSWYTMI